MNFTDPKKSAQNIVNLTKSVTLNSKGIETLAHMIYNDLNENKYDISMWKNNELHPNVADDKAIDWIFVIDCLNFSFWADPNMKYSINSHTGYWALCAAINRAIDNGIPITDPKFYANISEEQMNHIFRTDNGIEMPLIKERTEVLRESGNTLLKKFDGSFVNCVKHSNGKALNLLSIILHNFPSFRDETIYKGQKVSFYKRAQILIADIWSCFEGKDLGFFHDINELTMFADYRVPQVLAYFGAIQYSKELIDDLKKCQILQSGDEREIEIRGSSLWSVELIKNEIEKIMQIKGTFYQINSIMIDFYLWDYRRKNSEDIDKSVPFHRVRSIYY